MFDQVLSFAKVLASSVAAETKATLYNLTGIGGFEADAEGDESGEQAHEQEVFGAFGVIGRPRAPSMLGSALSWLEVLAARTSDGLVAFGFRDLRLHARFPNPKAGSIAFVGYGGAFLSFDDTAANSGDEKASIATLYVPYEWTNGVPSKAHVLVLDPTSGNPSVTLVHAEGHGIVLNKDGGAIIKNAAGDAYIEVNAAGGTLNGNWKVQGSLLVGTGVAAFPVALVGAPPGAPVVGGPALFMSSL